ncbi:PREDICTED: relaxin receptor 1-like [Branchiostoma belcheri]|uniref:Relaxin receptor 1-like n=1 Tax=Branchiostoma belcheri TaxID=7741 RepID=A0A6P5AYF2_BRABE|nr:PREDICTED: relaxin receptor 1-like [Branchiostoma belcheri]
MEKLTRVVILTALWGIWSIGSGYDPDAVPQCREPSLCLVGEFQCGNLSKCVPQALHCDGKDDCGNNDDEMFCGNLKLSDEKDLTHLEYDEEDLTHLEYPGAELRYEMSLCGLCVSINNVFFPVLATVPTPCLCAQNTSLRCQEQNISQVPTDIPAQVTRLFLQNNILGVLRGQPFENLADLQTLNLNWNKITHIEVSVFAGLENLQKLEMEENLLDEHSLRTLCQDLPTVEWLELERNSITALGPEYLQGCQNLTMLNLSRNPMTEISADLFEDIPYLQSLYFSKFQYCGFAPHVRNCQPYTDGISSFEDLLANVVLRTCVWIVSIVTCTGNTGVIIGRTAIKQENKVHSFFIQNLCASDLIMGIYLLIIGSKDVMLRGVYNQHAEEWKVGYGCKLSGFLAMLSAEVSVLLLTYMSVERFLCVVFPYRDNRPDRWQAGVTILLIWLGGFLLALVPLMVPEYFGNFYGSNGVCFPLHLHEPYMAGWEYSAFIFIGINFSSLLVIMAAYIGMFISIQRTRSSIATPFSLLSDMSFAKRFFFIVLTDSLVWLPITAIKFMALTSGPISGTTYAWIVIFVLPINSAINPILYSLTTKTFTTLIDHVVRGSPLSCGPEVVKGTQGVTTTGGNSTCVTGPTSSSQIGYPLRPLRAYRAKRSFESEMSVSSSCNPSVQIQFNTMGNEPMAANALSIRFHGRSLADVPEHPSCSDPSNREEEESSGDETSQKDDQTAVTSPADTLDTSEGDTSINEANEKPKTNSNTFVVSTVQAEICNPPDSPTCPPNLSKLPAVLCMEEHVGMASSPTKPACSDINMESHPQMTVFNGKGKVTAV